MLPWLQSASRFWNRAGKSNKNRENQRPARFHRHGLVVEQLEERAVPSITPVPDIVNNKVTFNGSSSDNLHLRVLNGVLQFSPDGNNFSSDLDLGTPGVQSLTVTS